MLRCNLKNKILSPNRNMSNIQYNSKFLIYTDGACTNKVYLYGKNYAKCSIGIHFSLKNSPRLDDVSEALNVPKHTNNVAELTAIREALKLVKNNEVKMPVHLYTDSEYSLNVLTKWYPNWTEKKKKTKKNIPLIEETYKLCNEVNPFMFHIRAHTDNTDEHSLGNAIADKLATNAFNKFENKTEDISKHFS